MLRVLRPIAAILFFGLLVPVASVAGADDAKELKLAARAGDLAEVKRLVKKGADVNAAGEWGTTPLILAAWHGTPEVVAYLLEKGANPDARERFFGVSALDVSMWEGAPDFRSTKLLLAAGARDRAAVLRHALRNDLLDLARTAVAAGPVYAYEAERLRREFPTLEGEGARILSALEVEKNPDPPVYTEKELAGFEGEYGEGEIVARVRRDGRALIIEVDGKQTPLRPLADRLFRSEDGSVSVRFSGRAGTVERMGLERAGKDPVGLRLGEGPITTKVGDLPAFVQDPGARPTVNWTGFRGTNRAGVGDGADTPVAFDVESGEGILWRADLPGLGNSSPVVWGDRIFITTAVAAGGHTPLRTGLTGSGEEIEEDSEHRWLVLAFDKRTGKKIWESEVGRAVPLTKRHFKATQANSTPVTDGRHVVAVFPTAGLACLGMDGKLHWKHELGGLNAGGFNDPGLQWGFAASPVIYKDRVILQVDVHDGGYLAAWDLKSGKELWRTERPDVAPSWSTPAVWSTRSGDELVVNASIIRGYDPLSGKELWSLAPNSVQVVASPVIGPDTLVVSSGYPPARPIYAVKPGIRGKHEIEADTPAPALAWHTMRGGAYMPTPLLYRGILYMVHHNARIVAHDARSGERVYQSRFSAGGTMTASPVVANGKIYQGTEEGTLYVLEAGPAYRELAVHEIGEPLMATPAISEGLLIVRTPSKLIAAGSLPATKAPVSSRENGRRN